MPTEKLDKGINTINTTGSNISTQLGRLDVASSEFRNKRGSIIASAKSNIFEFPVFMSSSIPIEYATATNALLEQVYASYLQMAISVNPVVDHKLANSVPFSGLKSDTTKYLEYTDTMYQHDACHASYNTDECIVEFNMIVCDNPTSEVLLEHVNHQPLSEFDHFFNEANDPLKKYRDKHKKAEDNAKKVGELADKAKADYEDAKDEADKAKKYYSKFGENNSGDLANKSRVKAPSVLKASDMDKLNTMKPILMQVDLNIKSDDGKLSPVQYIVGVKTFTRIIDADTIPEVAEYPLKEMNSVMRKAKWRAGELKFFSDIVFRIKQKKQTAVDSKDPKRKWYRRLYELAHMKGDAPTVSVVNGKSVIGSFVLDKLGKAKSAHGVIPNASIVVSKADVDICKMKTGIDLLNGKTAAKLCNELFLISFVVIDVESETIKVLLPDLHDEFDVHSLSSVNRQLATLDTDAKANKEFNRMLGR